MPRLLTECADFPHGPEWEAVPNDEVRGGGGRLAGVATDFQVSTEELAPWVPIGAYVVLRVPQLAPDDILWIALDSDSTT